MQKSLNPSGSTDQLAPASHLAWYRSRRGFGVFWLLSLMSCWFVLRAVLLGFFAPSQPTVGEVLSAVLSGLHRDFFVALLIASAVVSLFLPGGKGGPPKRWRRALFWGLCLVFWLVQVFLMFAEFYFFEEFKSRFNTVAVDYLIYPQEVFVNIWDSYNVGLVLLVCGALAGGWTFAAMQLFRRMWETPFCAGTRWRQAGIGLIAAALLAPTVHLKGVHISPDRTLNEIANNGAVSFVAAAWTRHLDYAAFYKTMPREEAYQRVRSMLSRRDIQFMEKGESIVRRVSGDSARPRLNVILILEESLGSKFWGCLGRTKTLTPEMDKLALSGGILFDNIYASGNRTVRGMEGVLSSFLPLPGDSIVKRDLSDNVETIARVLKRDGYSTLFLYGGRGLFDGMRSFAVRNGYDRFIEQKHFEKPVFTTIWGVCDEDLFGRTIAECRALAQAGQPFFATALTVSNHKPYTYPAGRIAENPQARKRDYAVKYSDYALGEFFRQARREAFWTNTIFVVVADHGDRVYGKQTIPINSYEIPLVILGPAAVKEPSRVSQLGCSLDVAPTILGLIGRPYETMFFGRDLLQGSGAGRVFLNHNRDIGMMTGERMFILGLMKTSELYAGNPKQREMSHQDPAPADQDLEEDTIAIFQVADELYTQKRFRLDALSPPLSRKTP
jgi:phosphoglycerol transferase MdoB-like AlkP superfamily enzyme